LTKHRVNKEFLKGLAKKVLEGENNPPKARAFGRARRNAKLWAGKEFNLSIALVGQSTIKELNKRYRGKNQSTDVLSFQYDGSGEVVICPEAVEKNARQFKLIYQKELARVLVHGILHVLGYNHQQMKQKNG